MFFLHPSASAKIKHTAAGPAGLMEDPPAAKQEEILKKWIQVQVWGGVKRAGTNQHTGTMCDEIYNKREMDSSAINISEQH